MTSSISSSGSVTRSAIYRNGIVPEGRPVVVRMSTIGNKCLNTNQAADLFQSAPIPSRGGSWAGITHCFPVCAIPAPLSGAIDACRNTTLRALIELCQQSARCFTKSFQVLSTFLLHGNHHGASHVGKIRNYVGAENELR